eukprot:7391544-Prymnesium_polylepis.2
MIAPPILGFKISLISAAVFQAQRNSSDVLGFQLRIALGISSSGPTSIAKSELGLPPPRSTRVSSRMTPPHETPAERSVGAPRSGRIGPSVVPIGEPPF